MSAVRCVVCSGPGSVLDGATGNGYCGFDARGVLAPLIMSRAVARTSTVVSVFDGPSGLVVVCPVCGEHLSVNPVDLSRRSLDGHARTAACWWRRELDVLRALAGAA